LTFALDATYSTGSQLSGVGVYSREILQGLAAEYADEHFQWYFRPHRLRQAFASPRPPNVSLRPLFESFHTGRPAIFHGLNQRLPVQRFPRTVCTFHDLFVLTSEYSTLEFRHRFAAQAHQAAARADLIICVSAFTAAQVSGLLQVDSSRLRVIPHGTHPPSSTPQVAREPVILHVGAIQLRKNLTRLVEAFEQAAPPTWRLVLAGSDGYGAAAIHQRIAESSARDRIHSVGWVSDQQLASLYAQASIFAFPSLDEGFGIPVLEAMAHGLPVLSSNRSALPEACGDAAVLVDPLSTNDIAHALQRLIRNPTLRDELIDRGRQRASTFSWLQAVTRTWQVYQELIR
jgi:glycosyltransferase involved in cell wall biosynthesis